MLHCFHSMPGDTWRTIWNRGHHRCPGLWMDMEEGFDGESDRRADDTVLFGIFAF
jgi:hypothetical protein